MKIISPKYKMKLATQVAIAVKNEWNNNYKNMEIYLNHWHTSEYNGNDDLVENFIIFERDHFMIDFETTFHRMPDDILLKIAIEMGVDTPGFIPSFPTFKNELISDYHTAYQSFEKAIKNIEEHPDVAVGLANSTLESIIKHILEDGKLNSEPKGTLETLMKLVLKEFSMSINGKDKEITEINKIASSLISISQNIEGLRSKKTTSHGKAKDDYVLTDSLYAYFIVNSVTTVGMFLKDFYELKFKK